MAKTITPELFDGPFPQDTPESERWRSPQPDHFAAEREASGNLPEQPTDNPVDNGPAPFVWGPESRDTGAPIKLRG